ncbi:hypothetical protein FOCC_FOCC000919 [Frankliniella occidentalis]|uniref:peptidylprolyl isomerase n=1 Tax=Frankliniella occidentalis TaxID=133901 RepID=A0A6J1TI54_FRAOC|nr:inactive peptidyl-prolyl cis-trans isomerase FKBP6 [Frankliniella occidentalis]KAE8752448.1 hypothetical protein FOCC_FOCC000919 [Frankliniella occidentalis]
MALGDAKIELSEGIKLSDLLGGGDVTFTVKDLGNEDDPTDFQTAEDVFDPDALIDSANFDTVTVPDGFENSTPFETLKERMTDVHPNGLVKKRIIREGIGEIISPNALVRLHYEGYMEFNEVPFDSTLLRGQSAEFVLGCSGMIPGLDMGVATMRSREKAEFILQPSVAFGAIGCPPRIPPNSEVLFVVEVMNWKEGTEAAIAQATANTKGEKSWDVCKSAVSALLKEGITLYNERRFHESKIRLQKAKNILAKCHLKNEEEEEEFYKHMFKVSLNLAIVFNELHGNASFAPSAIIHLKEADKIQPNNHKVHCQWGKALMSLGDLERAKEHLLKAMRIKNDDKTIHDTLNKLEQKIKKEKETEKETWRRAFNPESKVVEEKAQEEMSPEAQEMLATLEKFSADPDQSMMILPAGFTPKERELFKSLAEKLNLSFAIRGSSISISK